MPQFRAITAGFAIASILLTAGQALSKPLKLNANEARTARYFDSILGQSALQRMFLSAMPKGGDLHNHLDGSVYAESLLRWAVEDGLCFKTDTLALAPPPCDEAKGAIAVTSFDEKADLYDKMINALSTRNYMWGSKSGHDQFFSTFPRFGGILPEKRQGDMIAEVVSRLARQNTFYVELMMTPGTLFGAGAMTASLEWSDDLAAMNAKIDQARLGELVKQTKDFFDSTEKRKNELLRCGQENADAGCKVTIRYQAQVIRTFPRTHVFGQIALAAALAKSDSRIATLNLVNFEDHPITARDYKDQMRMVGFFTDKGKSVNVTLHAGELAPGLVPLENLQNHIRLAIEEAGAKRIGHGIDIAYEDNALDLLRMMARSKILVEVGLTSNDVILGVKNNDHPFSLYRRYGVPLALATDDEGVSRIDLTHEYQRAANSYNLKYADLKDLARNALEYSFLPGDSLWLNVGVEHVFACRNEMPSAGVPGASCEGFLSTSEKARLQWQLEADFVSFEARDWTK